MSLALLAPAAVVVMLFGRNFWIPIMNEVQRQRAEEQVIKRLTPKLEEQFPNHADLTDGRPLHLLAFKQEQQLELWQETSANTFNIVTNWSFTAMSGRTGPKLREGDRQIPEGIYKLEYLNPTSSYHLSMKLDYPNPFDRKHAAVEGRDKPGSDIFIHGKAATVGCIPIGDEAIESLFWLIAKNGKDNTTVIILPWDFRARADSPMIPACSWCEILYDSLRAEVERFKTP